MLFFFIVTSPWLVLIVLYLHIFLKKTLFLLYVLSDSNPPNFPPNFIYATFLSPKCFVHTHTVVWPLTGLQSLHCLCWPILEQSLTISCVAPPITLNFMWHLTQSELRWTRAPPPSKNWIGNNNNNLHSLLWLSFEAAVLGCAASRYSF